MVIPFTLFKDVQYNTSENEYNPKILPNKKELNKNGCRRPHVVYSRPSLCVKSAVQMELDQIKDD